MVEQKSVKWYAVDFRGQKAKVAASKMDSWNHEAGFTYYELQSTEGDSAKPSTLCNSVCANFWGMLACPKPLGETGRTNDATLSTLEIRAIMSAMAGKPCTILTDTRDMAVKLHRATRASWA